MSKKNQVKKLVDKYIDIRKNVYHSIQEGNSILRIELTKQKHSLVEKLFSLLTDQEYNSIAQNFAKIVDNGVSRCSAKEMEDYIRSSKTEQYFHCLELQKAAIKDLVDKNIRSKVTIIDHEDGIIYCAGEYHNGECYPE